MKRAERGNADAARLHVHEELAEVAVVALVEVPDGSVVRLPIDDFLRPVHLFQEGFQLLPDVPRGFRVEGGVLDPGGAGIEVPLQLLR